jgi:hypothetical protein
LVRQRRTQSPLRKRSVHDEDDGEGRRTYSSPPSPSPVFCVSTATSCSSLLPESSTACITNSGRGDGYLEHQT